MLFPWRRLIARKESFGFMLALMTSFAEHFKIVRMLVVLISIFMMNTEKSL